MLPGLGGRKFLLSLLVLIVGTVVQIYSPNGVNEAFVFLLIGVVTAFGASNAFVTRKAIEVEKKEGGDTPVDSPGEVSAGRTEQMLVTLANNVDTQLTSLRKDVEGVRSDLETIGKVSENAAKLAKAALGVKD